MGRKLNIYVDGSYKEEHIGPYRLGIIGYGSVVVEDDVIVASFRGYSTDAEYTVHHNPAGELRAVVRTLEALNFDEDDEIVIYHDYKGIAEWALGTWKCNIPLTRNYKNFMHEYLPIYNIRFRKVKALHKNRSDRKHPYTIHNAYNDMADDLANRAINDFIKSHGTIDLRHIEIYEEDFITFDYDHD